MDYQQRFLKPFSLKVGRPTLWNRVGLLAELDDHLAPFDTPQFRAQRLGLAFAQDCLEETTYTSHNSLLSGLPPPTLSAGAGRLPRQIALRQTISRLIGRCQRLCKASSCRQPVESGRLSQNLLSTPLTPTLGG